MILSTEHSTSDGARRDTYQMLRESRPDLFTNPPDEAGITLLLDTADMDQVEEESQRRLLDAGLPAEWGLVGLVFEDEYLLILRDAVLFPDGRRGTYVRVLSQGEAAGVAVLPIHGDRVVLLRHHRHATRQWHLEIPRGFGSVEASPVLDARRELYEELHATVNDLIPLGTIHVDTGLFNHSAQLYAAMVSEVGPVSAGEGIAEALEMSWQEVGGLIRGGQITDAFTLAALVKAQLIGLVPSY